MKAEPTQPSDEQGRVVPFRPRADPAPRAPLDETEPVADLSKYESEEREDDFGERMRMNMVGLLVIIALMAAGIWLVAALSNMQRNQDCYLSGRRNCVPIEAGPSQHG